MRILELAGCLLAGALMIPLAAQEPVLPEFLAAALLKHIQFLAGEELEGRRAGTPGERRAAEYVARELEKSGVKPFPPAQRFQSFDLPAPASQAPLKSQNVLGWIGGSGKGHEDEVIVLGAHLDHLGITAAGLHPGAEDNASGVAVLLEVAARLQASASAFSSSSCRRSPARPGTSNTSSTASRRIGNTASRPAPSGKNG